LTLSACSDYQVAAPVRDVTLQRVGRYLIHRVEPGETLYAIAWRYDRDYHDLARINQLKPPYSLHPGQVIYLNQSPKYQAPKKKITSHRRTYQRKQVFRGHWIFPAKGKIIHQFTYRTKGVDISGRYGEQVLAAANGCVVYAGSGIRGYGNLMIIKHGDDFLTAYAYNKRLLVHVGQEVKRGEPIASMGKTDSGRILLHFEIRYKGEPVNPVRYVGYS
jgi:lipoprotein NlpD